MPSLAEDLRVYARKFRTHGMPVTAEEMDALAARAAQLEQQIAEKESRSHAA